MPGFLRRLGDMPPSLQVMISLWALFPLWSLSFLDTPWAAYQEDPGRGLTILAIYWIGPLLLTLLMTFQHFLSLPIFISLMATLMHHASSEGFLLTPELHALRVGLLFVMAVLGVILLNRDTIYPYLTRITRGWRRAPRLNANLRLEVEETSSGTSRTMVLEDCSLSGLAAMANAEELPASFLESERGAEYRVTLKNRPDPRFKARLVWKKPIGPVTKFGFESRDQAALTQLISTWSQREDHGLLGFWKALWTGTAYRRSIVSMWALCMAFSIIVPACGAKNKDGEGSASNPESDKQAALANENPGEDSGEDEDQPADKPSNVAGAFLVQVQCSETPLVPSTTGMRSDLIACLLKDENGKQINASKDDIQVQVEMEGEILTPKLMSGGGAGWNFAFEPQGLATKVMVSVNGDSGETHDFSYDWPKDPLLANLFEAFAYIFEAKPIPIEPTAEPVKIGPNGEPVKGVGPVSQPIATPNHHLMFVSETLVDGTGMTKADEICGTAGEGVNAARGVDFDYVAVYSTSELDARDKINLKGPIFDVLGNWIAAADELFEDLDFDNGSSKVGAVRITHEGRSIKFVNLDHDPPAFYHHVWTGSDAFGRYNEAMGNCNDWTTNARTENGAVDNADASSLSSDLKRSCNRKNRVLCISQHKEG